MSQYKIDSLSDQGLLHMYAHLATNAMLSRLFNMSGPPEEILALIREVNRQISKRGLDKDPRNADK